MDMLQILGIAAGSVVGLGGMWMLRGAKRVVREPDEPGRAPDTGAAPRGGLTVPTRMAIGIAALIVGYHIAAWSLPRPAFGVPVDRWWIVLLVASATVVGSLVADRVERAKGI